MQSALSIVSYREVAGLHV